MRAHEETEDIEEADDDPRPTIGTTCDSEDLPLGVVSISIPVAQPQSMFVGSVEYGD